jgi:RimJ/RimL family protein N-acetyltransferase
MYSNAFGPELRDERVTLVSLVHEDFDELYQAASDPLIWEQHPNKDRWKKENFSNYFEGAISSQCAFKIIDNETQKVIGSTRIYDYNPSNKSILIGYTFIIREFWGTGVNHHVKHMLISHLFSQKLMDIEHIDFHIGANNVRSQISITRIGAKKIGEIEVAYYGEPSKLNYVYRITKQLYIQPR